MSPYRRPSPELMAKKYDVPVADMRAEQKRGLEAAARVLERESP